MTVKIGGNKGDYRRAIIVNGREVGHIDRGSRGSPVWVILYHGSITEAGIERVPLVAARFKYAPRGETKMRAAVAFVRALLATQDADAVALRLANGAGAGYSLLDDAGRRALNVPAWV